MKVNLEIVPVPMFSSFSLFADIDKKLLAETKTIRIKNRMETKTRVSTSFSIGESSQKINWAIDGFKTFAKTEHSYFSGGSHTSNYFVLSKKQGRAEYIEYVKKVVETLITNHLRIEFDEINILLEEPKF